MSTSAPGPDSEENENRGRRPQDDDLEDGQPENRSAQPTRGQEYGPGDHQQGGYVRPPYTPAPSQQNPYQPGGYASPPYTPPSHQQGFQQQGGFPQQPYPQNGYPPQPGPQHQYNQPQYNQGGYQQGGYYQAPGQVYAPQKSRVLAGVLGILLGAFGVHRFYLGHTGIGIVMLLLSTVGTFLTFGLSAVAAGIWGLVEGIMILVGSEQFRRDARGIPLRD